MIIIIILKPPVSSDTKQTRRTGENLNNKTYKRRNKNGNKNDEQISLYCVGNCTGNCVYWYQSFRLCCTSEHAMNAARSRKDAENIYISTLRACSFVRCGFYVRLSFVWGVPLHWYGVCKWSVAPFIVHFMQSLDTSRPDTMVRFRNVEHTQFQFCFGRNGGKKEDALAISRTTTAHKRNNNIFNNNTVIRSSQALIAMHECTVTIATVVDCAHWGCAQASLHLSFSTKNNNVHFVRTRLRNLIITKWQQILWIFAATQKSHLMPSTCARTTTAKFMSSEMVCNCCRFVVCVGRCVTLCSCSHATDPRTHCANTQTIVTVLSIYARCRVRLRKRETKKKKKKEWK